MTGEINGGGLHMQKMIRKRKETEKMSENETKQQRMRKTDTGKG